MSHVSTARSKELFIELLGNCQPRLMACIYALLHNMQDTEEVYQQVCLVLWQKFDNFEPGTDFTKWACSVGYLEVLNYQRRHRRSHATFSDRFFEEFTDWESAQPPEDDNGRGRALRGCLERLGDADRRLLEMRVYGQSAHREDRRAIRPDSAKHLQFARANQSGFAALHQADGRRGGAVMADEALIPPRLRGLFDAACDGLATTEQIRQLEGILHSDEGARRHYLAYCRLHVNLYFAVRGERSSALSAAGSSWPRPAMGRQPIPRLLPVLRGHLRRRARSLYPPSWDSWGASSIISIIRAA